MNCTLNQSIDAREAESDFMLTAEDFTGITFTTY